MKIFYDNNVDTLYIYRNNDNYYGCQDGDYIELKSQLDNKVCGYIILNYSQHIEDGSITKMKWTGVDFVTDVAPEIIKIKKK